MLFSYSLQRKSRLGTIDRHIYAGLVYSTSNQAIQLHNEGVKLFQAKDNVGAIQKFKEAIAVNPEFAEAHCNYGNALINSGQNEQALAEFKTKQLELKPQLAIWPGRFGHVLSDSWQTEQACGPIRNIFQ